ncbi:hypothetical protein D9619_009115 [Psilocybe cf. subviscida]|uniref:Uncharacterized protein n=1 Tax=Psilocybe cf. subviscida TaxID=2480587 RepID=A0A8H5FAR2_9AGAR|nr:hypothetical protein D9619_009115 [Psilocybe cf. subviscida]
MELPQSGIQQHAATPAGSYFLDLKTGDQARQFDYPMHNMDIIWRIFKSPVLWEPASPSVNGTLRRSSIVYVWHHSDWEIWRCRDNQNHGGAYDAVIYTVHDMLTTPYIAQLSFTAATLIISLQRPELVVLEQHRQLFCTLDYRPLSLTIPLFTLLMSLFIMKFKIDLAITTYRCWRSLRKMQKVNDIDAQFYIRVLVFGVFVSLGVIGNLISIFWTNNILADIFRGIAGTIVFLAFGTQSDVLRIWFGWVRLPVFSGKHPPVRAESILVIRPQGSNSAGKKSDVESLEDLAFAAPSVPESRIPVRSVGEQVDPWSHYVNWRLREVSGD